MMEWNGTEPRELSLWPSKAEQRKKGAPTDTAARRTRDRLEADTTRCTRQEASKLRCYTALPMHVTGGTGAAMQPHRRCNAALPTHAT